MKVGRPFKDEKRTEKRCPILVGLYSEDIERLERVGKRLNSASKSETVRTVLKHADGE
jgi:hypothetical protein